MTGALAFVGQSNQCIAKDEHAFVGVCRVWGKFILDASKPCQMAIFVLGVWMLAQCHNTGMVEPQTLPHCCPLPHLSGLILLNVGASHHR